MSVQAATATIISVGTVEKTATARQVSSAISGRDMRRHAKLWKEMVQNVIVDLCAKMAIALMAVAASALSMLTALL